MSSRHSAGDFRRLINSDSGMTFFFFISVVFVFVLVVVFVFCVRFGVMEAKATASNRKRGCDTIRGVACVVPDVVVIVVVMERAERRTQKSATAAVFGAIVMVLCLRKKLPLQMAEEGKDDVFLFSGLMGVFR